MYDTRQIRQLFVIGIAWPVLVIAAAFIWPGPDRQEQYQHYFEKFAYDPVTPPVDTLGSSGEMTVAGSTGSARIFWTQPKQGKVKMTIEVPPEKK